MSEWRPIETAPLDGTRVVTAYWRYGRQERGVGVQSAAFHADKWIDENGEEIWPPFLWMPLPEPPNTDPTP